MQATQPKTLLDEMERLADVDLSLHAELDQITMTFAELLDLDAGSLVQLSRPTGENIEIFVEEELLGWGEVLLMEGTVTVRLADLRQSRFPDLEEDKELPAVSGQEE
jgi:flagellar motor switch protein FliN/FliY